MRVIRPKAVILTIKDTESLVSGCETLRSERGAEVKIRDIERTFRCKNAGLKKMKDLETKPIKKKYTRTC